MLRPGTSLSSEGYLLSSDDLGLFRCHKDLKASFFPRLKFIIFSVYYIILLNKKKRKVSIETGFLSLLSLAIGGSTAWWSCWEVEVVREFNSAAWNKCPD
jgi:hypothetical protein